MIMAGARFCPIMARFVRPTRAARREVSWSIIMRLLIVAPFAPAFAQPAFAQPALAREHYHHRSSAHGIRSYHHLARSPAHDAWRSAAWRRQGEWTRGEFVERTGVAERRPPQAFGAVEPAGAWGRTDRAHAFAQRGAGHGELDAMIARHAQMNGVPETLVHRVVIRESRYNAHIVGSGGAMGLMQIKLATARAMGYTGTAAGLLDPETNLTYAVRYLAGAYRVAGGNVGRAVANYARGYRDTAVREGAARPRSVASVQTSGWSDGYASAAPVERVASVRSHGRRQLMRSH
jgi:soluble lytic murein transglycosylase-like protein